MREVFRTVEKVATTDISVLITGETGTGKELIARAVHQRSPRKDGPFVVVNCGAIPENLIESELFGHVRGAFTGAVATRSGKFQQAHGGTLFLDEIGELPLALQVKLLRALQEKVVLKVGDTKPEHVDIRVVAATNRDLEQEMKSGNFREDLFYRLNVINIHLPPLRERGDDVLVSRSTCSPSTPRSTQQGQGLHAQRADRDPQVPLAGQCAAAREPDQEGDRDVRQDACRRRGSRHASRGRSGDHHDLTQAREDFQRRYILEVLERNNGNRTKTAQDLGVDPRTIFRYLEREPGAKPNKIN